MPFTLSHAVLAPPIAKLTGNRLPVSALAIGCMTPDLYRLFTDETINSTHTWQNIGYPTLILGWLFVLLWYFIYRPACMAVFGLSKPLPIGSLGRNIRFFLAINIALLIGIATHLLWDGLTHVDFRTFAFASFLAQPITLLGHTYPLHRVLQVGMSVLALPLLGLMLLWFYHKYKTHRVPLGFKIYALLTFCLCLLSGTYCYLSEVKNIILHTSSLYEITGRSINYFMRGYLACFTLMCIALLSFHPAIKKI